MASTVPFAHMRQLVQDVSSGAISIEEVPAPARLPGTVLVATRFSVISAGTERTLMELGRASLVGKARARPDLVRKVVRAAREEGVGSSYAKVRGRLGEPNPLGYSLSGIVLEAGVEAAAAPGDLVACAGAGYASHAEVVAVPHNLCAPVPDAVTPEDAAYATIATVALHGVRLAEIGLGSVTAVIGLGVVGQLAVELIAAAGAVPLACDPDTSRVELARAAGFYATTDADELVNEAARRTAGRGADAAVVCAGSRTSEPLAAAVATARERAVISIIGDVPVEASRNALFGKELRLVVSRSYGPGRYDPEYEERGRDYPAAYVRWTEGRNLTEVLRLMEVGALKPHRLTTHTFDLQDGPLAYEVLRAGEPSLGIVLRYQERRSVGDRHVVLGGRRSSRRRPSRRLRVGVIGAGAFARTVLLPSLNGLVDIAAVATATGISAHATARRFGAGLATSDAHQLIAADDIDAVVIATRHDTHAAYAVAALEAGKHVFVEKPLGLHEDELARVESATATSDGILMVGFNRRFAPLTLRLRDELAGNGPMIIGYRVNAGPIPQSHWTQDPEIGGGRLVGEACHFVDLATFLAAAPPTNVCTMTAAAETVPRADATAATLSFADGTVAQLTYSALGDPSLPKERVEVLGEHGAGVLDDFRVLTVHRHGRARTVKGRRDKGHRREMEAFVKACQTGEQPWPVSDMAAAMRATFAMRDHPGRCVAITA